MVEEMTAAELHEKLASDADVQVVDTRSAEEFETGHVPGAENLPYPELAARIDEIDWGEDVVLVCEIGESSRQAARILESYEGIDETTRVWNVAGGYEAWEYELEEG